MLEKLLTQFYQLTLIPTRLYTKDSLLADFSKRKFEPNSLDLVIHDIKAEKSPVGYTITDGHLFFGYVRIEKSEQYITIGPTSAFKPSMKIASHLIKKLGITKNRTEELLSFLQKTPNYNVDQSLSALGMMNTLVNGYSDMKPTHFTVATYTDTAKTRETPEDILVFLSPLEHGSDLFERELLSCVEFGRPDLMQRAFDRISAQAKGIPEIDEDAERAFKNIFIFATGVISRSALRGGLDYDTVNEVTEYFLTRIEQQSGYDQIFNLLRKVFMNFANRVAMNRDLPSDSLVVNKIKKTVSSHLHKKITPTILAGVINMDVSYLCRHFKAETGKTISTYINEQKIAECQRLLSATDMSIIDISEELGFTSSNYMSSVFNRITGMTPTLYRSKIRISE